MDKRLHAIAEAAEVLGVSTYTLRRHIRAGEIATVTIGARRMIPSSELQRIVTCGVGKPRRSSIPTTAAPQEHLQ